MAVYFIDTSALVKGYVQVIGSDRIEFLLDPESGHSIYVSDISEAEVSSILMNKRRVGSLNYNYEQLSQEALRTAFEHQFHVGRLDDATLKRASMIENMHALKSHDAKQLAIALKVGSVEPSLIFVSAENDLIRAATAERLPVENPNNRP